MMKPKVSKEELAELAQQIVKGLTEQAKEIQAEINLLEAKKKDIEAKIRWIIREILS